MIILNEKRRCLSGMKTLTAWDKEVVVKRQARIIFVLRLFFFLI